MSEGDGRVRHGVGPQRASPAERTAWIALASTDGVGDVTLARLLERYGTPSAALRAVAAIPARDADRTLAAALSMRPRPGLASAIAASAADPGRVLERAGSLGAWLLTPYDDAYPDVLHDLPDPPPVLYGLGRQEALAGPSAVAVVGTRRPTGTARDLAARIAARLATLGATVVSGLAVGVDGIAHATTLRVGGTTIGVSGSGLEEPAPRANRSLARAILAGGGAIIGELAPWVRPSEGTFPRRNRIISALAMATIVVEAPARSGALITARHALEQGRLLLVAPGRPLDPAVAGCLALLRETPARPLVDLDAMVEDLELGRGDRALATGGAPLDRLSAVEREVATALAEGPQTPDRLIARTGRAAGEVAAALTILQVRGLARSHGSLVLAAGALLASDDGQMGRR